MPAPGGPSSASLLDVLERVLDKGVIINADITVSLVGTELLGIRLRAAIASFETAVRYGLEFPGGTRISSALRGELHANSESCPRCGRRSPREALLEAGCPWCGWVRVPPLPLSTGAGATEEHTGTGGQHQIERTH